MAAIIDIIRYTNSGSTSVKNTNSRIDASDNNTTNSTGNPIVIPTSGTNYSYWASYQLYCSNAPVTLVNNFQIYSTGENNLGNGVDLVIAQASEYEQATGTIGNGTQLNTTNYTTLITNPSDFFGFTENQPLNLTASTSATGPFGYYFVMQYTVSPVASAGPVGGQPVLTIQWDED